jgi:hypothetical protein
LPVLPPSVAGQLPAGDGNGHRHALPAGGHETALDASRGVAAHDSGHGH